MQAQRLAREINKDIEQQLQNLPTMLLPPATGTAVGDNLSVAHNDQESEEDCAICLEALQGSKEVTVLPCNHRFHTSCAHEWFLGRGLQASIHTQLPASGNTDASNLRRPPPRCPLCKTVPINMPHGARWASPRGPQTV